MRQAFRRRLAGKVGAVLFRGLRALLKGRSQRTKAKLGARLGRAFRAVSRKYRVRCRANLELAFPELDSARVERMAVRVFEHFGTISLRFAVGDMDLDRAASAEIDLAGTEHIVAAYEKGDGVLLMTAHFGEWELLPYVLSTLGIPCSAVTRRIDEPSLEREIQKRRESQGVEVFSRGNAAASMLRALRAGKVVVVLADQNSSESYLPFFGHPTGTVLGPAVLSLRTGSPMVPAFSAKDPNGRHSVWFQPPLQPCGDWEKESEGLMTAYNQAVEAAVRKYPDQYLWFHDRWRSARQAGLL